MLAFIFLFIVLTGLTLFTATVGRAYVKKAYKKHKKSLQKMLKKQEHIKGKTPHEIVAAQLNRLEADLDIEDIGDLSKMFTKIIRQYFRTLFNINYEFTYEELLQEMQKEHIDPRLQKILSSFFKKIPEIEFGGSSFTKAELGSLMHEMRQIVNLVSGTQVAQHAVRHIPKKITGKGLPKIYHLVTQCEMHLRMGEVRDAAKLYAVLKREYDLLPETDKQRAYDQVMRLFDEIKLSYEKNEK